MAVTDMINLPALRSNGQDLSTEPSRLGRLIPSDPNEHIQTLRTALNHQGYLWLKGILPRAEVLALRARFFERMAITGILASHSSPEDGIFSFARDTTGRTTRLLMEFVRTAAYEAFCFHPAIWQFYEKLMGGDVYLHKRKIVRQSYPADEKTTDAHYDLIYLRGGTDSVLSSWIPLGDIPVHMGGLIYLEGADSFGRALEADFATRAHDLAPEERIKAYNKHMSASGGIGKDLAALADHYDTRWLVADYEAGDMVIHTAYMIHAATQNNSPENRMRLSTDIRYQRIRDEIDARWTNHWSLEDIL